MKKLLLLFSVIPSTVFFSTNRLSADVVDFNRDIRPLLSDKCFQCHGPDHETREADLRFDVESSAKETRDGTTAIAPGKPNNSELLKRIRSRDPDLLMPPPDSGKSLKPEEIRKLEQWISAGAKWSKHWAYERPTKHPLPKAVGANWSRNWIDNFILQRLNDEGLKPSPDTDPVTFARRLHFDLTGLPPTPEFVQRYEKSPNEQTLKSLVDELLNSPHFGERLAMYWLDLVRYADTVGYHGDQDHNISPYRDWVISAFNANLPFDEFTRAQLAGDLLPNASLSDKVASGYNRLLQTTHEGGLQPREYRAIYAADRVRNLSVVWMGATVGCAQCHDHKYDPYTSRDFYALSAFFADVDDEQHFKSGTNSLPTRRPPEVIVYDDPAKQKQVEELRAELNSIGKDKAKQARRKQIDAKLKQLQKQGRACMVTAALTTPRTVRLLPRGNWLDETGPVLSPQFPEFLQSNRGESSGPAGNGQRLSRLDLANWLTDAENGYGLFTARVFANRFWFLMFGEGLSTSLDDFGGQGQPPTYPALLDELALEFVRSGWDIKHMFRVMAMSHAYAQSSKLTPQLAKRDPDNRLFARQSRYRLPAESVRDTALFLSGLLVDEFGGASVKPYQPTGYYRHLNFPQRKYAHHTDNRQWRRGVYVHWQRQFLHPMLRALDAPSREECTARRPRSNTPTAALVMLNDPSMVEAARVFAARIIQQTKNIDARLRFAFELSTSRLPDEQELKILRGVITNEQKKYAAHPDEAQKLIQTGQAPVPTKIDPVELAAWSSVSRALLNLSETNSRN